MPPPQPQIQPPSRPQILPLSSRRSFLKLGAGGVAILVGGGYIAARLTDGTALALLPKAAEFAPALTPAMQQMLFKVFDAIIGDVLPEGDPGGLTLSAVATLDSSISGLPPALQKELKGLLNMLAFAPTRFALAGRWSGWENATRGDVSDWLNALQHSRLKLRRLIYVTLHDLATSSFYALAETWPLIGYDGPMLWGPGEEV